MVLHGHTLTYVDQGEGPAVLFVHGLLGSHENWAHLIDTLDETHRVIVPDLFGHGASAKIVPDFSLAAHAAHLRDLLDRLDIDRVTIVGHSLGGGISLEFCYLFPERVSRLVLVGSGGLGREVHPVLRSATLPLAEYVLPVLASPRVRGGAETFGRLMARLGIKASHDIDQAWQGFASLTDAESRRAFLATTRAVLDPGGQSVSARDFLSDLAGIPTLVVWGTRDMVIPPEHAEHARAEIPGARVELFEGAGHFPHLEQPDRFAAVLNDFIATTVGAGRPAPPRRTPRTSARKLNPTG
jgi:pimeloyl-ACP methyl ester carboxylesterase